MFTLRSIFKCHDRKPIDPVEMRRLMDIHIQALEALINESADSRPHPATSASVGPSPSPVTAPDVLHWVGEGPTSIYCPLCGTPSGPFRLAKSSANTYICSCCRWRAEFVGGDVPLEGGDSPSPPTTTDRINKALIDAAAVMREQNDRLAAVHRAIDRADAAYPWDLMGPVGVDVIDEVRKAIGG